MSTAFSRYVRRMVESGPTEATFVRERPDGRRPGWGVIEIRFTLPPGGGQPRS